MSYKKTFKKLKKKESDLNKGSLQRKMPFDPKTDVSLEDHVKTEGWQWGGKDVNLEKYTYPRENTPRIDGSARKRAMRSLHGKTEVRKHPKTGERMFLLHRGHHSDEKTGSSEKSSWTPNRVVAEDFANQYRDLKGEEEIIEGTVSSAWIPEGQIHHIPKQFGASTDINSVNLYASQDNTPEQYKKILNSASNIKKQGSSNYKREHEVIVNPHSLMHAKAGESKTSLVDSRINERQRISENSHEEGSKRANLKNFNKQPLRPVEKSEIIDLIKTPIIADQDEGFETNVLSSALSDVEVNGKNPSNVKTYKLKKDGKYYHRISRGSQTYHVISLHPDPKKEYISVLDGHIVDHPEHGEVYTAAYTGTHKDHQSQGLGSRLKKLAAYHHGKIISDGAISGSEDGSWKKVSKDPNFKVSIAQTADQNSLEAESKEESDMFNKRHVIEHKSAGGKIAASEAMSNDLNKGSLQRKMPFDPRSVPEKERNSVETWTQTRDGRDEIPEISDKNALKRGIHKLHGKTEVRKHPKTGERMFLMHRGVEAFEHDDVKEKGAHDANSSWSPSYDIAHGFAKQHTSANHDRSRKPEVLSAWISENQIHHIPSSIGEKKSDSSIKNSKFKGEHEVIVKPHGLTFSSPIKRNMSNEVEDVSLDGRINERTPNTFVESKKNKLAASEKETNDLAKMSQPTITFPKLGTNSRPDSEVQVVETPRQKKIFARKSVISYFNDKGGGAKPTPTSTIDRESKRIENSLGKRYLGVSVGSKTAAVGGKAMSAFEKPSGDNLDKLKDHMEKRNKVVRDYNDSYLGWKEKEKELASQAGTSDGHAAWLKHRTSKPDRPKLPRKPSAKKLDNSEISPKELEYRGKRIEATKQHEGLHNTLHTIKKKYGKDAFATVISKMVSKLPENTLEALNSHIKDKGYKSGDYEEVLTHARDILTDPKTRDQFKLKNKDADSHIKNIKQAHKNMYQYAKNLTPKDIGHSEQSNEDLKIAAKTDMNKGEIGNAVKGTVIALGLASGMDQVLDRNQYKAPVRQPTSVVSEKTEPEKAYDSAKVDANEIISRNDKKWFLGKFGKELSTVVYKQSIKSDPELNQKYGYTNNLSPSAFKELINHNPEIRQDVSGKHYEGLHQQFGGDHEKILGAWRNGVKATRVKFSNTQPIDIKEK